MSKFRYGSSFFITTALYILIGILYLNFLNSTEIIKKKSEQVIKIAIITPIPKAKPKPIIEPKPVVIPPKPKPKIKKPKPKPKPKKRPKPKKIVKPKKVVKKIKPKPVVKEVYIEPVVEEIYIAPKIVSQPKPKPIKAPQPPPTPKVNLRAQKEAFKRSVRNRIVSNKKYPAMAKRRRITGTVHVIFDIGRDGTATNIRTEGASAILQKAVRRSLRKSFPIAIPQSIVNTFPMRNVSVNIDFKLQ